MDRVDQDRIERFLSVLGRTTKGTKVKLFLAGGSQLVWLALKKDAAGIDFVYDVDPKDQAGFADAIRTVKEAQQVDITDRCPAGFIPVPAGHKDRGTWVAKFGTIDVFLYDSVSAALALLHRGRDGDLDDVVAMTKRGLVTTAMLEKARVEIAPQMGAGHDPERVKRGCDELARR